MKDRALDEIIEPFGLLPMSNPDMSRSMVSDDSIYAYTNDEEMMEAWKNVAYEWSKFHHRILLCHEQRCKLGTIISEYDQ